MSFVELAKMLNENLKINLLAVGVQIEVASTETLQSLLWPVKRVVFGLWNGLGGGEIELTKQQGEPANTE